MVCVRTLFCRVLLLVCFLYGMAAVAEETPAASYVGRTLVKIIDEFRQQGVPFAYSTNLVSSDLTVTVEPVNVGNALDIVSEILAPHQLSIRKEHGLYLVVPLPVAKIETGKLLLIVREETHWASLAEISVSAVPALPPGDAISPGVREFSGVAPGKYRVSVAADGFATETTMVKVKAGETAVAELGMLPPPPEVETITVSSSRYDISRDLNNSSFFTDQRTLQQLPDLGDDPIRASHRLPGVASTVLSSRAHFRGGEDNETAIILDGYELFDPFHARDFNSFFSVIDPRAIDGVEVFTGGFPVQHGNRLSGLVVMDSIDPGNSRLAEVGVSVFNTSILSAGGFGGGRGSWVLSARRSNLDLVIEPRHGVPRYYDLFGRLAYRISPATELSANLLYARDDISVILANHDEDLETASSETDNLQAWAQVKTNWTADLSSTSLLFVNSFSNKRAGIVDDAERMMAAVSDDRDASRYGLRQDWDWIRSERHLWRWGFELGHEQADYRYAGRVQRVVDVPVYVPGNAAGETSIAAAPGGTRYSAYLSDKMRISSRSFLELGLRWDDENYTGTSSGPQIGPRISFYHALSSGPEIRLSWGRYFQPPQINELQIEDGVSEFWQPQQADHVIVGLRWPLANDLTLRLETYQKDMRQVRTRYENLFDPLELLPEVEPDRIRVTPSSARARGMEILLDRNGSGPWSWWMSYALSEVTDVVSGERQARSWDQRHEFQAGLNYSSQKWDFGIALNAHSGWPTTDLEVTQTPGEPHFGLNLGPRNAQRFAYYASVDARLSRRFPIGDNVLTTFVEVTNALDRNNPCCVDFDVDVDDEGQAALDRQEDGWLPILPSIGFLFEF